MASARRVSSKGGEVRVPTEKTAPALLASLGAGRPSPGGLPGLGRPPPPHTAPLGLAPFANKLDSTALQAVGPTPAQLCEHGLTQAAMGLHVEAIEILRDCTARDPTCVSAWRKLAQLLRLAGRDEEARAADAAARRAPSSGADPESAVGERSAGTPDKAERKLRELLRGKTGEPSIALLRERLDANPLDAAAMRLLAEVATRAGDTMAAWALLERALEVCPTYVGAREDYAESLLWHRARVPVFVVQAERLLRHAPRNARYRRIYAYSLSFTGNRAAAADILAGLVREHPRHVPYWDSYAHLLHSLGRRNESEQAYRKCLEVQPDWGEAYSGLADLKGKHLKDSDIAVIHEHLKRDALEPSSRMHMLYAVAYTREQAGDFAASFAAYADSARQARELAENNHKGYRRSQGAERVRRQKNVFTPENLRDRLAQVQAATPGPTPIFVVGMPRAGSTLVEQILASHSLVEGTNELPLLTQLTNELADSRILVSRDVYPECLLGMGQEELAALGARVIERSRIFRQTDLPFFVDKRPWNWLEAGLLHLILPHAKIIDIRREPMAACFAMFKQMLPIEVSFSTDLADLAQYYNNYVSMMEHWRSVIPGRVHFLQYERLVEDTETEIRRLLDYCGLPFEEGCLRFWENDRAVSTPSSEQVRRPIFRSALEHWRNFEPWLGSLKEALDQPADV
jgi:predicted Zn-dependent protease